MNWSGPHHGDGSRGAVEVPVEGKSRQLALQLDADAAAILLVHQGNLGLAAGGRALTSRETGPDHLTQVGKESPDRRPQTSVQLLGGKRENSVGRPTKTSCGGAGPRLVRTCALLWMAAVSMLSCHTHCRSVRRIWYSVSPNQLLVSSRRPPMSAGSQGWCRRRRREASGSITHRPKTLTGSKYQDMVTEI